MKKYPVNRLALLIAVLFLVSIPVHAIGTVDKGVRLSVRNAPAPVTVSGKAEVFYELHIENLGDSPLNLTEVALRKNLSDSAVQVSYRENELQANLEIFDKTYRAAGRDFLRAETEDPYAIYPGMIGVVFINFKQDVSALPAASWVHRLSFQRDENQGSQQTETISGGFFTLSQNPPVQLHPPLQGGLWWAYESMANDAVHRRAMVMQLPTISQRYGVDYIKVGDNGTTFRGADPSLMKEWYGYGEPVFAVADGVVTDFVDGIPENEPLSMKRVIPMTIDTINGNYLILELGNGAYAVYGHMIPGSLTVKLGESVQRGQIIGRVGNSGNSEGPHLHFHIGTENMVFGAEGLPYVYPRFRDFGAVSLEQMQTRGFDGKSAAHPMVRTNEIPANFSLVEFPHVFR